MMKIASVRTSGSTFALGAALASAQVNAQDARSSDERPDLMIIIADDIGLDFGFTFPDMPV